MLVISGKAVMTVQIEKENSNKIKVTLQPLDLREMNISIENLKPNSPQLNRFLYEIMEKVREETGFNPYNGQIVVEAVPRNEGIVLTVTRLEPAAAPTAKAAIKKGKFKAVVKKQNEAKTVFFFDVFDDLCRALTMLSENTLKKSDYYSMGKSNILVICGAERMEKYILKEYASSFKNSIVFESHLKEYAKHIAGGDKLVSMAKGIAEIQD